MSQHHHHSYSHQSAEGASAWKLLVTFILNMVITLVEFIGGILSGSLALISDAMHNLSDGFASLVSLIALKLSQKERTPERTFGYKRAEILAALLNASVLIGISIFLFKAAYERFLNPAQIDSRLMFIVALIGLLANLAAVLLLHREKEHSLNIRSAYLHLLGDTISSVAVIGGSVVLYFWQVNWLDPLLTILIGLYVLKESWSIVREAVDILMIAAPKEVDLPRLKTEIEALPEVASLHHVHVWRLTEKEIHFQAHVDINADMKICEADQVRKKIEEILKHNYGVAHITLQMEANTCSNKDMVRK